MNPFQNFECILSHLTLSSVQKEENESELEMNIGFGEFRAMGEREKLEIKIWDCGPLDQRRKYHKKYGQVVKWKN